MIDHLITYIFPKTLAKYESAFNGKIYVREAFGKKYIEVGGLMQTGKIPEKLFREGFKHWKLSDSQLLVRRILVMGVGGGTVLHILHSVFPDAVIIAIDIDPVIVEAGKKYFDLDKIPNAELKIANVFDQKTRLGNKFDLIIVDLFQGYEIPIELGSTKFLLYLKRLLNNNGTVIFNRLYFQRYKNEADTFLDKVKEIFHHVDVFKNYFNVLIKVK